MKGRQSELHTVLAARGSGRDGSIAMLQGLDAASWTRQYVGATAAVAAAAAATAEAYAAGGGFSTPGGQCAGLETLLRWLLWEEAGTQPQAEPESVPGEEEEFRGLRECFCEGHLRLLRASYLQVAGFGGSPISSSSEVVPMGLGELASLRHNLCEGHVRLLRASYLLELHNHGGRIQRRQDLPERAFWEPLEALAELAKPDDFGSDTAAISAGGDSNSDYLNDEVSCFAPFLFAFSYRWLTLHHPDPDGYHLALLAPLLLGPALALRRERGLEKDLAVFWDFACLMQRPLPCDEEGLAPGLDSALTSSASVFAHDRCAVVIQPCVPEGFSGVGYKGSGWCCFEGAVSSIVGKDSSLRLDLSRLGPPPLAGGYAEIREACRAQHPVPRSPEGLARELESLAFARAGDLEKVTNLYRSIFAAATAGAERLLYAGQGWGPAQAFALTDVLPRFRYCRELNLGYNPLGDEGVEAVAGVLPALPALRELFLFGCDLGRGAVAPLGTALTRMPELMVLDVDQNPDMAKSDSCKDLLHAWLSAGKPESGLVLCDDMSSLLG